MPSKNFQKLKNDLAKAAAQKNIAKRGVCVAAVIAQALREVGQDPVLVGGAAVEFYSEGGYTTRDIDLVAPGGIELQKIMKELGFSRKGKDYIQEELKLYIEFPSEALGLNERSDLLDVDGISLQIISIEDLIVDRLCAYKFWKSEIDGLAALTLLELGSAEPLRLEERARQEDVDNALKTVQNIFQEVFRKKMSPAVAAQKIKDWLHR